MKYSNLRLSLLENIFTSCAPVADFFYCEVAIFHYNNDNRAWGEIKRVQIYRIFSFHYFTKTLAEYKKLHENLDDLFFYGSAYLIFKSTTVLEISTAIEVCFGRQLNRTMSSVLY